MNKEWLKDYAAHENEEYQRFLKDFSETGKIEYPSRSRFKKLTNPVVDTTLNIWSMIPFFGSSLIHVHPCSQEILVRDFGWGSDSDINNLIQLSKDTGRVQFILDKSPEDYESFDYLEPILKEIQPPLLKLVPELLFDKKDYQTAKNEYDTLSDYKFLPFLKELHKQLQSSGLNYSSFEEFSFKFRWDYATLRLSGYGELADLILNALVDDPEMAFNYLLLFGVLLTPPKYNSFNLSYNPVFSINGDLIRQNIETISSLSNRSRTLGLDKDFHKYVF